MKKRGGMTTNSVLGLILAIAVVFLLVFLAVKLLSPMFDRGDETAKSYLSTLMDEIKIAKGGGEGEFFMWDIENLIDGKEFYLVYFKDKYKVNYSEDVVFNFLGSGSNRICICYTQEDKKTVCEYGVKDYCEDLGYPVVFGDALGVYPDGTWFEESGHRISIKKEGENYVFSRIEG